jgi:hypothetical protein
VTWNDFGNVELVNITDTGIVVSEFADTNTFGSIRMHLRSSAHDGMVFNDAAVPLRIPSARCKKGGDVHDAEPATERVVREG